MLHCKRYFSCMLYEAASRRNIAWLCLQVVQGLTSPCPSSPASRRRRFTDFEAADIDGNMVSFSKYAHQVCLVVNVASA